MSLRRLPWLLLLRCLLEVASQSDSNGKREVQVKEVVLDSAVVDIVYLGKNHANVMVTTKSKRLYFSEDSGQSWTETTGKVDKSSSAQIQVERVIVNPTDKTVAVLQTQRRARDNREERWWPYIYITEDSGKTWRRAWGKQHGLHSWISHPTERSMALVSWWSGDCSAEKGKKKPQPSSDDSESSEEKDDETAEDQKACVHKLMVTKDLGRTFLQIADYVVQFSWGTAALGQTSRVYFTQYRTRTGDQSRLTLWTMEVDFLYIDLSKNGRPKGKAVESLKYGNKFLISGEFVLVAKTSSETRQTVHLMVSKDGGKSFKAALLPSGMGELEEKWYTVLDTSEGAVIMHINSNADGNELKETGRIFVSDSEGYKYSQSLINNVRSGTGECEFDKVTSLQGVYLANIVVPDGPGTAMQQYQKAKERSQEEQESSAAQGSETDKKHGRGMANKKSTAKAGKEERTIRTVISFDKGGAWNFLKPPRVNSLGKEYDCAGKPVEECALHLHGTTSWDFYAPFYSSESCVGIVMGTGNVGPKLRFEPEETSTFLSRDGGLTWSEAHKGAFIYEFGDHGGLIVMADDLKKTSEVIFTWNEGQSWYDFKVSKTPFEVDNIITEPNVTSTTFIMFGTREEGVGVMYYMKFDSLQFPACQGVWAADSVSSDYETWVPSDGASTEKCLLGQQVTYTRRKSTSQCWNGEQFERPVVSKKCQCSKADYACDLGFMRDVGSKDCVFGGSDMMPARFVPTVCSGTFSASAYRKVPGDQCEGGWSPEPAEVPCPSLLTTLMSANLKYALLGALVLGIAYLLYGRSGSGSGGGKPSGFGEFTASTGRWQWTEWLHPMVLIQIPVTGAFWLHQKVSGRSRGFNTYNGLAYKRVQGDEFDISGLTGNEESLTDFIDEAEYDDHAPRVYDGSAIDDSRREDNRASIVSGGARTARAEVPRLQAPVGSGSAQHFDMSDADEDLL